MSLTYLGGAVFCSTKLLLSSPSLSPSGPSDRRSQYVQRHPEKLGCLQTARGGPGLSAAPAALAVVLRPAAALLAGRLVASPLNSKRTDKHTFV